MLAKFMYVYCLTIFLISCATTEKEPATQKLNFVFITTCVNEDFFKPVQKGMKDAARLLDVNCSFIGTIGVDAEAQAKMVDSVLNSGADGIAVNIIDSIAFDEVIAKAISRNIPVVSFNSDDNYTPNKRLSSVCQNLYLAGQQCGKALADKIDDGATVILTVHSDGISALEERVRGIQDALKGKNIEFVRIVTTNIIDSATNRIEAAVKNTPRAEIIICTGLADTEGAGNVIASHSSGRNIRAGGFDLSKQILQHIENGNLLFTIDQQPYMQGFLPVQQLTHYKRYGLLPSTNEIGAAFVTPENITQVKELTEQGFR